MKLYLAEKRGTEPPDSYRRAEGQVKRSVALTQEALGRDPVLTELTREEARAVRDHGAREVHAVATHALMTGEALGTLLYGRFIDSVTVSDSTSPFAPGVAARAPRFRVLESGPLIAAAIRALHDESDMGAVHRAALRRTAEPA